MKTNKKKILGIIICCILAFSYLLYVQFMEQKKSKIGSMDLFGENASWEYGKLMEGDRILSSNGWIYYTNMSKKMSVLLCSQADCEHNTEDCTAVYASNVDFMFPHGDKMYLGCTVLRDLEFYRANLDGSGREKIASYPLGDEISETQYIVEQSKVYIAVAVEDTSQMIINDDGGCSDVPIHWDLLCFDFDSAKYEKIGTMGKEYYQHNLYLRYIKDHKLYFEFDGQELPEEEMYHPETGELLNPEFRKYEVEGVASVDLDTGQNQLENCYETGDYVGNEADIYYFLEFLRDHRLSGDIRLERDGSVQEKIHIKELEQKKGYLYVLQDHFVFNEEGEGKQKGKISFFDRSGKFEFVIEETERYILGEAGSYYLLGNFAFSKNLVNAYITKDDVKQLKTKAVNLWEDADYE